MGGWLESEYSDRIWLSFSLALAKPNNLQRLYNSHCCLFVFMFLADLGNLRFDVFVKFTKQYKITVWSVYMTFL